MSDIHIGSFPDKNLERALKSIVKRIRDLEILPHSTGTGGGGTAPPIYEGPGIDIVGGVGSTIGVGLDSILVAHVSGQPASEYAANDSGLESASATAAAGDTILLPVGTITGDHTLAAGVRYFGLSRYSSILAGRIIMAAGASLENLTIQRAANDGNPLYGILPQDSGSSKIANVDILVTQSGSGDAFGIYQNTGSATISLWMCNVEVTSVGGSGYGAYRNPALSCSMIFYGGRVYGNTYTFNE